MHYKDTRVSARPICTQQIPELVSFEVPVKQYLLKLHRSIVHTPYIPFSILFTRAVHFLDRDDLGRLERFAESLKPEQTSTEPITRSHRLYELLCQAARLYIEANTDPLATDRPLSEDLPNILNDLDLPNFGMNTGPIIDESLQLGGTSIQDPSAWYFENQQLMSLLDEDVMFSW